MLETGIKGSAKTMVTEENTASAMGSGSLEVFATPAMVALMEECSWKVVLPYLEEGQGTVGTGLEIQHLSATPLGMEVTCQSTLTEVDGRKLTFEVEAYDAAGLIGKGTHQRFIVDNARFQAKANAKAN